MVLIVGTYSVTVTDANGCSATAETSVEAGITIMLETDSKDETCTGTFDGSIDLTVIGGTAPFTYSWNTGEISEDISGLGAGTYMVTVTDANGCSATTNATIEEGGSISLDASANPETCAGAEDGNASVTASAGTEPYSYLWSNGETTASIEDLAPGNYSVTVEDANGCSEVAEVTVDVGVALGVSLEPIDIGCDGENEGSIDLTVSGGDAPYTYLWSNGEATEDISGLSAGSYSVTVTDANGCSGTGTAMVEEGSTISATAEGGELTCDVLSVTLMGSSSIENSQYAWSGPDGFNSNEQNPEVTVAGTYFLVVTGPNGCTAEASAEVTGNAGVPDVTAEGGEINCITDVVQLQGSSTSPGVTFSWTGPNMFESSEQNPMVSEPGVYNLTVYQ